MGLFDKFRQNRPDDGTYHRDRSRDTEAAYGTKDGSGSIGGAFRLTVQDVFSITGRGTVVTGQIESGEIAVGDFVTLRRANGISREIAVTGIEMFRKLLDAARRGDNVGLLLRGVSRNDVERGDVLEKP